MQTLLTGGSSKSLGLFLGLDCHRFGQLRLHVGLRDGYMEASFLGAAPTPRFPLDMPSRTRCTPLHHLLPSKGKKRDRAVPTPDWRGFAGGDLGSTLVVGSLVAVETVFELMRVSRTCSHGKLSEGLQTNAAGCREPCVDRRDNQRQKKSGPRMQDKGETCSFQDSGMGRRKRRSKWSCQRWRMCVEADGRDTDRQLHISGGLACGKRCQKPGEECSCLGC